MMTLPERSNSGMPLDRSEVVSLAKCRRGRRVDGLVEALRWRSGRVMGLRGNEFEQMARFLVN